MTARWRRLAVAGGCAWLLGGTAWALDPARALADLNHVAWRQRDGAPSDILGLAQTPDGYLWLATTVGLVRFDGVTFTPYQPGAGQRLLSNRLYGLFTDSAGRLWVRYTFGGTSVIDAAGRITHFPPGDVLPPSTMRGMAQQGNGTLWGVTSRGIFRFDGRRWSMLAPAAANPGAAAARSIVSDRRGTLWLASADGVFFVRPNGSLIERFALPAPAATPLLAVGAGLSVKVKGRVTQYALSADYRPQPLRSFAASPSNSWLFEDSHGSLMYDTDHGIERVAGAVSQAVAAGPEQAIERLGPERAIERFGPAQGMAGDWTGSWLEDRSGAIWIGGNGGLDRFRDNRFRAFPSSVDDGGVYGVEASDAARMWVVSASTGLRMLGPRPQRFPALGGNEVTVLARATDGSMDFAGIDALWHFDGRAMTRLPAPPVPLSAGHVAQGMLRDGQGRLWLSQTAAGLFRLDGDTWQRAPVPGMYDGAAVIMHRAPDGALWFGYPGDRLARLEGDVLRRFSLADGLDVGDVLAVATVDGQLWVGGERGIGHFDGQRFRMLRGGDGSGIAGVSAILPGDDGALWLNGSGGIVRIAPDQLRHFLAGADDAVRSERFDDSDGAGGGIGRIRPLPSASAGADGRLWFITSRQMVSIDPRRIDRDSVPPTVHITALRSGGASHVLAAPAPTPILTLPPHTQMLEIGYTGLSMNNPERIRFRYRLDGVDREWEEAGTRRVAYYSNLGPGHYRFHLVAANADGVWNTAGTTFEFAIAPAYDQTWWFRGALGLAALAALWALVRVRGKILLARREGERAERERIARELHDTLLQGTQGLIFGFHSAVGGLPRELPARATMERILDSAEAVLKQARDGVHGLRSQDRDAGMDGEDYLVQRILADLPVQRTAPLHVLLKGRAQALRTTLYEDTCAIVREAIVNAMRHSAADLVTLTIHYGCRRFEITVADDGVGLPADVLASGARAGHWGLTGMRERARKLRARLDIHNNGQGSQVRLRMSAALAYEGKRCAGRLGWPHWRCRWDHKR